MEANATRESLDAVLLLLVKLSAEDLKSSAQEARKRASALRPTGANVSWTYEAERQYFLALMDSKLYAMRAETAESLSTSLSAPKSHTPVDRREQVRNFGKALKKVAEHVWVGLDSAGHEVLASLPQQKARTAAPDPALTTLAPNAHMQALLLRVRNL